MKKLLLLLPLTLLFIVGCGEKDKFSGIKKGGYKKGDRVYYQHHGNIKGYPYVTYGKTENEGLWFIKKTGTGYLYRTHDGGEFESSFEYTQWIKKHPEQIPMPSLAD
ncbi:MAG: hypothetical protein P8I97_09305 [Verrucomicrobiales bacterium]|nr:hypothetical protein [Verrucomicrobiales bacterium]